MRLRRLAVRKAYGFPFYTSLIFSEAMPRRWQGIALPLIKVAANGKAEPFRTARAAQPQRWRLFKTYVKLTLIA
jgi:hypothetical protein